MSLAAITPWIEQGLVERHQLGMAEMGYPGLSEQWLLRRAGDLHWRLIARAMGQREAVFTCSAGEPLYAAFCATSLKLQRPELPRLGGEMTLSAHLYRIGHGRLASLVRFGMEGQQVGRLILVSTFVGRSEPDSNRSIVRRAPKALAMPPEAPRVVQRVAQCAADVSRLAVQERLDLRNMGQERHILPCPASDFNAAGLLYFPSFSALADRVLFEVDARYDRMITSRHVIYLGNIDPGERVNVRLLSVTGGHDAILCAGENRPLALMRMRYHRDNGTTAGLRYCGRTASLQR